MADWASLLGLAITLVGFSVTLYNVRRSRQAAEAAEVAARAKLLRLDAVAGLSTLVGLFDEITQLHREGRWQQLPDKYRGVRRSLVEIRVGTLSLSERQLEILQGVIVQVRSMERSVEVHLAGGGAPNQGRLNKVVAEQSDLLTEVLTELKTAGDTHVE